MRYSTQRFIFWPINLYFLSVLIYFSSTPLRTFGLYQALNLLKVSLPLVFCLSVIVWGSLSRKLIKDGMLIVLLVMIAQSLVVGLIRQNNFYYIVSDFATTSTTFFIYLLSSTIRVDGKHLSTMLRYMSNALLFVGVVVIIVDYYLTYFRGISSYLSYGESYLILPFSYFLFNKKIARLTLLCVCIFLGGRVGILLSCLGVYIVYLFLLNRMLDKKKLLMVLILIVSVLNIFMYLVKDYSPDIETALPVVVKMQNYNYFHYRDSGKDIDQYGAGRMSEIRESFDTFEKLPGLPYVFGAGAGFLYNLSIENEIEATHNVHFSILNMLEKYGLILLILFYFYWIRLLYNNLRYCLFIQNPDFKMTFGIMIAFCVGMFIFSFTAFTVFVELFPWFFLGFMNIFRKHEE